MRCFLACTGFSCDVIGSNSMVFEKEIASYSYLNYKGGG